MDTIYDLWLADRRIHRRSRPIPRRRLGPIAGRTHARLIDPFA